ncbi:MAG: hypothetical protein FWC64_09950 [Treponema sp.]|nr:hypothetical protein [Treponema sp.]
MRTFPPKTPAGEDIRFKNPAWRTRYGASVSPPAAREHSRIKLRQGRIYGLRIPPKEHGYGASVSFA